jgi:hypothetical protein
MALAIPALTPATAAGKALTKAFVHAVWATM